MMKAIFILLLLSASATAQHLNIPLARNGDIEFIARDRMFLTIDAKVKWTHTSPWLSRAVLYLTIRHNGLLNFYMVTSLKSNVLFHYAHEIYRVVEGDKYRVKWYVITWRAKDVIIDGWIRDVVDKPISIIGVKYE